MTCDSCGRADGWHDGGCPNGIRFSLGMGTMPLPRVADLPDDEMQDCAPEGIASLEHQQEAAA